MASPPSSRSWVGDGVFLIVVWALVSAALLFHQLPLIAAAGPLDPDSQMRLVEVRDFLAGTAWTDMLQPRIAPPDGVVMHWSRLIDLPIAALIRLADPSLGREKAELFAISAWPLALYLVYFFGIAGITRQLFGRDALVPAIAFAIFAGPALGMFLPGTITHHNAQIALLTVLLALALRTHRSESAGVAAGLVAAVMLSIGLETLPLVGMIAGGIALGWAFDPIRTQPGARAFGLFFACGMIVQRAFAAAPADWLTTPCDIASYPYVAVAVVGGLGLAALTQKDPMYLATRLAGLAVLGIVALGVVAIVNPTCLKGPYAQVDPRLIPLWLNLVTEARSVFQVAHDSISQVIAFYLAPIIALAATIRALARAERTARPGWLMTLACLATAIAVSLWQLRGSTFASVLAVPGLTFLVLEVRRWGEGKKPLAVASSLLAVYLLPNQFVHMVTPIFLADAFAKPAPGAATTAGTLNGQAECSARPAYARLAVEPTGIVLVGSNLGPSVLLHTPHSAVSAPFHRNTGGILDGFAAFGGSEATAREIVARRHVGYVMICPADDEMGIIAAKHPDGLAARLMRGDRIDWLQPIETSGTLRVWRVSDPTLSGWIDTIITGSNVPRPRALPRASELRGTL
ncbi:MAG: hypothetical protein P4L98_22130 [Ancalomicrobiaceae bacterium]|nr:hypothetical protein [Ancalomicrobiaceae bacterium]